MWLSLVYAILEVLFSTHPGKTKSPEIFCCVFWVTPVEVIRLHERENLTAYATNMSGLDVPWRASFGNFGVLLFFLPIRKVFLLTIWSMAGHTSPNNFVFLLVLFRLVCNREAKKNMDLCLVCGWHIFNFLTTHDVRTW